MAASTGRRYPISFRRGDKLPDNEDYVILPRSVADGDEIEPLGGGGAGLVFKALYKTAMERAIKFLSPAGRLKSVDSRLFEETFLREIAVLVEVTHTHIAKITDYGTTAIEGNSINYYAMDFIDGVPLAKAWSQPTFTGRDFLEVIDQLLSALEYLHAIEIMHCDVKSDNVLVHKSGPRPYSATLVDLGVAKVLRSLPGKNDATSLHLPLAELGGQEFFESGDGSEIDLDDNRTYFFSTPRIVRPKWKDRLRRVISRSELREMFPSHELYTIGVILDDALADESLHKALREELRDSGLEALGTLRDRLKTDDPREDYYRSISDLRQDWAKLDSGYLSPLKIPEMALAANAKTSVALPTGRVSLTDRVFDIVNHPLFQRLHDIPQLELSYLLFPGAKHSRFLHSLTVFDLTRQYLAHLLGDPKFRLMVEPVDIQGLLLRALLHDIGHYPLSHMFEDFASEQRASGDPLTVPTDDDLFWQFVAEGADAGSPEFSDYATIIDSTLEGVGGGFAPLRRYLHEAGRFSDGAAEAMGALVHPTTESHAVLAGILSSPVDADKVSYLMDDSLMTGARYGLGIDLDALLGALRAPNEEDLRSASLSSSNNELLPTIGLRDKGLTAAESVVLTRYWMLKRVYWHHTSRAVMSMVKFAIATLLKDSSDFKMEHYIEQTMFGSPADGLRALSDALDSVDSESSANRALRNPLRGLLDGGRATYKRVLTVSSGGDDGGIYSNLAFRRWIGLEPLAEALMGALEAEIPDLGKLKRGDLIVDVPARAREELGGRALIYMAAKPDVGRSLTEDRNLSPILAGLKDEFDLHAKKCRVFVHPEIHATLEPHLGRVTDLLHETVKHECRTGR